MPAQQRQAAGVEEQAALRGGGAAGAGTRGGVRELLVVPEGGDILGGEAEVGVGDGSWRGGGRWGLARRLALLGVLWVVLRARLRWVLLLLAGLLLRWAGAGGWVLRHRRRAGAMGRSAACWFCFAGWSGGFAALGDVLRCGCGCCELEYLLHLTAAPDARHHHRAYADETRRRGREGGMAGDR